MPYRAAIIGGGAIGAGWAARFLLMGWDVAVCDTDPDAVRKVMSVIDAARRSLPGLSDVALPPEGQFEMLADPAAAVRGADWIQESLPDRLDLKRAVFQELQAACSSGAIIGSSTGRFSPAQLQVGSARPGQIVVAHPCNPVYLMPLVELRASAANPPDLIDRAAAVLTSLGLHPLRLRSESDGPVGRRLMGSVLREALRMIRAGQATTAEIDDAIRYGFGLQWAQTGLFETIIIADEEANISRILAQFELHGESPVSEPLGSHIDAALIDLTANPFGHQTIGAQQRGRDDTLVTLLRALKARDAGAGKLLNAQDRRMDRLPLALDDADDLSQPLTTLHRAVPLDWTDYNGHMTEARYLHAFGEATDRLMALVGCDMAYVASGVSFFTAETHIRHVDEVLAGTRIHVTTQVLLGQGKKMHLFHRMFDGDRLLATGEHMLIHVSLATRKACAPDDRVAVPLGRLALAHASLPWPDGAGRAVGRK